MKWKTKILEKTNETENWFSEKIIKIDQLLERLFIKNEKKKNQKHKLPI